MPVRVYPIICVCNSIYILIKNTVVISNILLRLYLPCDFISKYISPQLKYLTSHPSPNITGRYSTDISSKF